MRVNTAVDFIHRETSDSIIRAFYAVYNRLGFGFLESVYRRALALELKSCGLTAIEEFPVTVHYRGTPMGHFRSDLLANDRVMLELKVAKRLHSRHTIQLRNALRAGTIELGMVLNFGPRPEFKRLILMNRNKPTT